MENSQRKIRIAVLTRGDSLESWEIAALKKVKQLAFAEIVLEIRDSSLLSSPAKSRDINTNNSELSSRAKSRDGNTNNSGFLKKITSYKWSRLFWNRWFKKYGKVAATREESTASIFSGVPRIDVVAELKGKFSQHFSPADLEKVKSFQPDVILRFGFNILRGEILNVAPHGVWSYHHADPSTIRGGPASFWEYILKHNITGAILQRLTDKLDDGIVLRSGYWSLVKHSFRENLDALLNNTSGWMANALTEIHLNGKIANATTVTVKGPVYSYPGNFRMLQFWCVLLGNKIAFHWKNLFRPETWQIGIVDQPIESVLENGIRKDIRWLRAKKNDSYLADPSCVTLNGKPTIIAEYFCGKKQRSRIVDAETESTLIETDYHISFPLYYEEKGIEWILTESSQSNWLNGFMIDDLSATARILNKPVVDPVVVRYNGLTWLFCHLLDDQNNAALHIFYAEGLIGKPFQPHALNPVKTDIRNSRSAGAILNINGKLIRPAQDSALTYGNAIVLNEITELTPTSFAEKVIQRIEPNPNWDYNRGVHTLSAYGNQTLIDAKSFRFNFANFKAQLSRKARRISGK